MLIKIARTPSLAGIPPPPHLIKYKLPVILIVTKLKGRENFKIWVFNITYYAHTYGV